MLNSLLVEGLHLPAEADKQNVVDGAAVVHPVGVAALPLCAARVVGRLPVLEALYRALDLNVGRAEG